MTLWREQLGKAVAWTVVVALSGLPALARAQSQAAKQSVAAASTAQPPVEKAPAPKLPPVEGRQMDRVVAIVNGDLILDSDVDEERRFEAFQPYREGPKYSRDRTIERLINRDLILQQAKLIPETAITDADVDREVADLRKNIPACKQYNCNTQDGWSKFLAAQGFTVDEFRALWKQRMQVLAFIEERFKQGIQISDADVKKYYDEKLVPQFSKQGTAPPKLADVAIRIQGVLLEQRVSSLLSDWLKSLRAQGQVVVLHPGESAP